MVIKLSRSVEWSRFNGSLLRGALIFFPRVWHWCEEFDAKAAFWLTAVTPARRETASDSISAARGVVFFFSGAWWEHPDPRRRISCSTLTCLDTNVVWVLVFVQTLVLLHVVSLASLFVSRKVPNDLLTALWLFFEKRCIVPVLENLFWLWFTLAHCVITFSLQDNMAELFFCPFLFHLTWI